MFSETLMDNFAPDKIDNSPFRIYVGASRSPFFGTFKTGVIRVTGETRDSDRVCTRGSHVIYDMTFW